MSTAALREAQRDLSLKQMHDFSAHLSGWVAGAIEARGAINAAEFQDALDASRKFATERAS